jgi:metal-responsive CopG/Arc/MetJ family transcriptional regulator
MISEVFFMRITVNLNEETLKRVDEEAKKLGTSRGAMLTAWIGEKLTALDMSRSFLNESFQDKLIEAMKGYMTEVKDEK